MPFAAPAERLSVPHWLRPASVSTPRSSNRTCGFAASGSRRRLTQSPWPLHVTSSATSENSWGVIRLLAHLPFYRRFLPPPATEALASAGITPLRQYCQPLRHPRRPSRSLTSCQLIRTAITAGTSRVPSAPLCLHSVANAPAGRMELIRSYHFIRFGLRRCFDCYRVERTSSRAGLTPAVDHHLFTAHPVYALIRTHHDVARVCRASHQ